MVDSADIPPAKIWSWRAKDHPEIPAALTKAFATTDDCKPLESGKRLLVCSSSGGCALLELPSGKALWSAKVPSAHSIEALPRERILVAASVGWDKLVLFDRNHGDKILWDTPMHSAHGLVWDDSRKRLYALGFKELRTYSLKDWESDMPSLTLDSTVPLPDDDGHDFRPVPKSADIVFSTASHVWLFDRDKGSIRSHPEWADRAHVKCIDVHPASGRVLMNQATGGNWWSDTFQLFNPAASVKLEGEILYKGRWLVEP